MDLAAYLDRIGFDGEPAADRATLEKLQRLHLRTIPYENLDVQLGRTVTTDPADAFDKLVTRRRGGWCYEMNGLFGWALAALGFPVVRLASGVMRSAVGAAALGNHLVLRVDLAEGAFLADVGLGDGPVHPFAVAEGPFTAGGADYRVERGADGWWRLHNRAGANPPDFDFHLDHVDEAMLSRRCVILQTDPESMFVKNLVCQRMAEEGLVQLRGKVLQRTSHGETSERLLGSADELTDVLAGDFGIDEPAAAGLW
ncbi:MAG: arylamine N-acetyltransferase, partial [Caulobacteraceae bacterium]